MRSVGRYLERVTRLQCAGRLALHGKVESTLDAIARLDSGMCVSNGQYARLYFRFCRYRHVASHWSVCLRENLTCDTRSCCSSCALRHCNQCDEFAKSANRAASDTGERSSRYHELLP